MPQCWVGVGGNQGDFPLVYSQLQSELSVHSGLSELRCSSLYRTTPMGVEAGSAFFNAVIGFQTALPPESLLDTLQSLEFRFGRKRTIHWGPRTLDLDLVYYGDQIISTPRLTVPHAGRICRRFVLDPLVTLASDWLDPVFQVTVAELLGRLARDPRRLTLLTQRSHLMGAIEDRIRDHWPDVGVSLGATILPSHGLTLVDVPQTASSGSVLEEFSQTEGEALPGTSGPFLVLAGHDADESFLQAVFDAATAAFEVPHPL